MAPEQNLTNTSSTNRGVLHFHLRRKCVNTSNRSPPPSALRRCAAVAVHASSERWAERAGDALAGAIPMNATVDLTGGPESTGGAGGMGDGM